MKFNWANVKDLSSFNQRVINWAASKGWTGAPKICARQELFIDQSEKEQHWALANLLKQGYFPYRRQREVLETR